MVLGDEKGFPSEVVFDEFGQIKPVFQLYVVRDHVWLFQPLVVLALEVGVEDIEFVLVTQHGFL